LKLIQESGEAGLGKEVEGVNSSMIYLIYYKSLCKYSNIPPLSTIIIIIKRKSNNNIKKKETDGYH
jgi:hypothetical protein